MLNLQKKNRVKKKLYSFIFFRLMGWSIQGTMDRSIKKSVVMVLPHTSNFDFFLGLFTRGILKMEIHFVGKKELFVFPFGYYFRSIGGAPLDRTGGKNNVDATVELFKEREIFRVAIAPEGTRKKVNQLRSGFYYIALKAKVPIIPVAFDYGTKQVRLGTPFYPTGDYEADMQLILPFFAKAKGKFPNNQFEI